jgi:hypothetical protein
MMKINKILIRSKFKHINIKKLSMDKIELKLVKLKI